MDSVPHLRFVGFAFLVVMLSAARAADVSAWPMWRGSSGTGIAPDARPPTKWSDEQNIRWKTKVPGFGYSTPIVWQDRIFLLAAIEAAEDGTATPGARAPSDSVDNLQPKGGKRGGKG